MTTVANKDRVSKAGLAALNKELYGHIYSCRKTPHRLLTFGSQRTVVCLPVYARFSLSFSHLAPRLSLSLFSFIFSLRPFLSHALLLLSSVVFPVLLRSPHLGRIYTNPLSLSFFNLFSRSPAFSSSRSPLVHRSCFSYHTNPSLFLVSLSSPPCQSNRIPFPFLHAFFSLAICLLDYHLFVRCYVTHFIITPAHFSHSCFRFYENVLLKTDNYVPGN